MRIAILSFLVIFMSCAGTKNTATPSEINDLKEIVNNKKIEVNFNWARPTGGINNIRGIENLLPRGSNMSNIDLMGNPNFFRINGDSIHMDLPYYGQRQISGGYNSDSGVKFEGKPKEFSKTYNSKKNAYILKYSLNENTENYNVTLTLFSNKRSSLNINSTHRSTISYDGKWKEYVFKKK
ncbi:DUF4251 domain-containing protein [Polaribacter haliotis]|uniref:DUF4251 domain-containing protein n=1 Tax=Polaribacter haliotis TaxID=1888915 RepID=A0A7L8AH65_9FLAO|nr:DUF4251 domain-containing protein [Polaribacter haliotis]QOD61342.1 DUF4251 domain-containing protein [Polaribacter haliotis]